MKKIAQWCMLIMKRKILCWFIYQKYQEISQDIGFCFAAIILDNNYNNIRFYLWDIRQRYIEIGIDLNLNFYIWLLSELISQLNALFKYIFKVLRLMYCKLKVFNHRFTIYYHTRKKNTRWQSPHMARKIDKAMRLEKKNCLCWFIILPTYHICYL